MDLFIHGAGATNSTSKTKKWGTKKSCTLRDVRSIPLPYETLKEIIIVDVRQAFFFGETTGASLPVGCWLPR